MVAHNYCSSYVCNENLAVVAKLFCVSYGSGKAKQGWHQGCLPTTNCRNRSIGVQFFFIQIRYVMVTYLATPNFGSLLHPRGWNRDDQPGAQACEA